jgi:cephalosporin hydroxylase
MPDALDLFRLDLDGFTSSVYPSDAQGWGSDAPIFAQLIGEVRPRLIVEVGTWKGASALHMAAQCDELGLEHTRILCIDTWLGAYEFIGADADPTRNLMRAYGWPQVYYQFVANVKRHEQEDRILAFPQTSQIAARWLHNHVVAADLIYLDGSHDEADVAADIRAYWPLLRSGGVLFGDDYDTWAGVREAVKTAGHAYAVAGGRYWVMRHD